MTRRLAVSLPAGTIAPAAEAAMPVAAASTDAATAAADAAPATANATETGSPAAESTSTDAGREAPPRQGGHGLLASLLLALLGGLVLNLMPCVLPVLSLKALSLAQGGADRASARRHALAYTAGVLLSFLALGALALGLRKAGLALGWGFQLQQPAVVAVLGLVIFALGLSLSGLWQASVALGDRAGALVRRDGLAGDFATGVLAVVLATPCTAPFMGAALAYAFTGPTAGGLLVFLALGLGLALPFLLIGFVPALARWLPRPGAWMDTFKQLLAFPLYATAAWLLFVLASLRGADAVWLWGVAAILVAFAAWAWSRGGRGWRAAALLALLAVAWPLVGLHRMPRPAAAAPARADGIATVAWSEQALADLRGQGRVVFENMTAEWCVSCKANEKAVFARQRFRDALEAANAVYMVGDYTDVDPTITAYLQRHQAVGVPLYVVYPRGGGEGRVLPVILTPALAEAALARAAAGG
jgi:thiol:disulfide interchange protein DsbD